MTKRRERPLPLVFPRRPSRVRQRIGPAAVPLLVAVLCCVSHTLLVSGLVMGGLSLFTGWWPVPFLVIGLLLLGRVLWPHLLS